MKKTKKMRVLLLCGLIYIVSVENLGWVLRC